MKYSIIVPIYKIEEYIRQCIDSVLHQKYEDWELILVDDGSPDRCSEICDEYARIDDRVKVIHKANGGLVSARKAGLEIATGDYAICLDGDDFLHEDCLQKIDNEVGKYNPDVVCHGYIKYSETDKAEIPYKGYRFGYYSRENIEKEIFPSLIHTRSDHRFPPMVWAKAFKMNIYRNYQLKVSSEISMGEDGACTYPLISNATSLVIMKDCLHYYRQIQTSMTKVKKPLKWDNYDKVFALYSQEIELDRYGLRVQYDRARTHNLFNITMSQFYQEKPFKEVVAEIESVYAQHPEYSRSIHRSDFSSIVMRFAKWALQHKYYMLLYIYANHKTLIVNVKDSVYKVSRNIGSIIRGGSKRLIYSCLRNNINFGAKVRIASGVDLVFHPGCIVDVGKGAVVGKNATIAVSKKGIFKLGTGSSVGGGNHVVCHNHIVIGNNTLLGPGIMIYDHNHKFLFDQGVDRFHFDVGEVVIGNNSWIGANTVILMNVHIGDNVVIGAGSVVTKDIPSNSIAAGIPAKVINRKE